MIDRRRILALLAGLVAIPGLATAQVSRMTAYAFSFTGLKGGDIKLADYAGKPVLVVNTASQCGYTPQYAGLQELWTRYRERGLVILGVPSNDFGGQEPGGASEIEHTAHQGYGVTFPLAAKAEVRGAAQHPFYKWAASRKAARAAALEFPQIPDRPRRPRGRQLPGAGRARRSEADRGDRQGTRARGVRRGNA